MWDWKVDGVYLVSDLIYSYITDDICVLHYCRKYPPTATISSYIALKAADLPAAIYPSFLLSRPPVTPPDNSFGSKYLYEVWYPWKR